MGFSAQTIEQTKNNVEKKQALTYEEMEAEREEVTMPLVADIYIVSMCIWIYPSCLMFNFYLNFLLLHICQNQYMAFCVLSNSHAALTYPLY